MATFHPAENNITAGTKGGLLFGVDRGLLVDGDLVDLATAVAAVEADNNALHPAQQTFGVRVTASLRQIPEFDDTYLSGGDADKASMLAINETADRGRTLNL